MSNKPEINLRQFKRFEKQMPWGLIRKIVLFGLLGYAVYYSMNSLERNTEIKLDNLDEIEGVEIDSI